MPRALIVKLGAIGDVIMAIPAAHALHAQGYAVDWLCGLAAAPVLQLYPWIHVLVADEKSLLRSGKLATASHLLKLWPRLFANRYDLIATLYFDPRYKLLTLPLRAPRKVLLSRSHRDRGLLPGRHHTDEYARILFNRPDGETPTQLAPIPAPNLPPNPHPLTARPRIVLIPAGARNLLRDDALRRWPVASYVALAEALLASHHEVILAGGPDDAWASPAFTHLPVTDLTAKLTLPQTLALFDSAAVSITHDTGPLHLAGITRTAIVALFGPTDPRGRLPQRHNCVALWGGEGFACRPCYDGRDYAPCKNNGCLQQITPAMVLAEVTTLLAAQRDAKPLLPRIRVPEHTPIQRITP
jgi:heptosyltransferase-2